MGKKDIISKEAIKRIAIDLATILLELDIDPESLELLETEKQRIEDRRADLVARVQELGTGHRYLLHIEIQNSNDTNRSVVTLRMRNGTSKSPFRPRLSRQPIVPRPPCVRAASPHHRKLGAGYAALPQMA